jgi:hypothetical protein
MCSFAQRDLDGCDDLNAGIRPRTGEREGEVYEPSGVLDRNDAQLASDLSLQSRRHTPLARMAAGRIPTSPVLRGNSSAALFPILEAAKIWSLKIDPLRDIKNLIAARPWRRRDDLNDIAPHGEREGGSMSPLAYCFIRTMPCS